mmetsp:Transcript_27807/g.61250  ORF Transcript_27807/g.61250 Transcript_27807/m.61250 type:complete len:317 (-) Transcript_27807:63-1013(-)
MTSIINTVANILHGMNPSLCTIPPRGLDDELCYMGPDGIEEGGILCEEIGHDHAMDVGSWMIKPERHATEGIVGGVLSFLALIWLLPKLRATSPPTIRIRHPKGSPLLSLICLGCICYYKLSSYKNRIFWLVMPCNMQWVLTVLQCHLVPESYKFLQFSILQIRMSYLMSVVIGLVTPETDDCTQWGELEFYWLNHFALFVLTIAYIGNGSVSCYPSKHSQCSTLVYNAYWWLFSCILFYLFYFGPVTVMAIYTGLNLNFMLHPPHDHFLLKGENFRLVAAASLGSLYTVSRLVCLKAEKAIVGRNNVTKVATKQQ